MSLKKFFNRIGQFFSKLWKGLLPDLKKAVHIGVVVVDAIKNFDSLNPEVLDILTAIIPGDLDDKIKDKIREKLPSILIELRLVDATLNLTDPQEIVKAAVQTLQQLSGDYKASFLNSLAIIIARVAADGKLDWNDAIFLEKWYYDHRNVESTDTSL